MGVKDYLNRFLNENEDIDFQKDFMDSGMAVENGITEDDVDPKELELGIEVEMEHTSDSKIARKIARKIALDHLVELKDYYTRLKKMEDEAFSEMGKSEQLEEKRKKRKKRKKNLYRGYIGYYTSPPYGGGDGDSGGDGGGE